MQLRCAPGTSQASAGAQDARRCYECFLVCVASHITFRASHVQEQYVAFKALHPSLFNNTTDNLLLPTTVRIWVPNTATATSKMKEIDFIKCFKVRQGGCNNLQLSSAQLSKITLQLSARGWSGMYMHVTLMAFAALERRSMRNLLYDYPAGANQLQGSYVEASSVEIRFGDREEAPFPSTLTWTDLKNFYDQGWPAVHEHFCKLHHSLQLP